jgi:hypothetical protein
MTSLQLSLVTQGDHSTVRTTVVANDYACSTIGLPDLVHGTFHSISMDKSGNGNGIFHSRNQSTGVRGNGGVEGTLVRDDLKTGMLLWIIV